MTSVEANGISAFSVREIGTGRSDGSESVIIGDEEFSYFIWDGQRLAGDTVAFDTETSLIQGWEIPELALASASDGESHCLVHPGRLAEFLDRHQDLQFVCHNAAFDFWVVDQFLRRRGATDAAAGWWATVDDGRLHDTMLLDMLVEAYFLAWSR